MRVAPLGWIKSKQGKQFLIGLTVLIVAIAASIILRRLDQAAAIGYGSSMLVLLYVEKGKRTLGSMTSRTTKAAVVVFGLILCFFAVVGSDLYSTYSNPPEGVEFTISRFEFIWRGLTNWQLLRGIYDGLALTFVIAGVVNVLLALFLNRRQKVIEPSKGSEDQQATS